MARKMFERDRDYVDSMFYHWKEAQQCQLFNTPLNVLKEKNYCLQTLYLFGRDSYIFKNIRGFLDLLSTFIGL
jgi:hypothetical protein